jgi:transglutaminase-like putative cysteine protease
VTLSEQRRIKALLPLQLSTAATVLTAVWALTATAASPGLGSLMIFVVLSGLAASGIGVWRQSRSGWVVSILIVGAFFLGLGRVMGASVGAMLYPPELTHNTQVLLAATFVWAAIACCFDLTRPGPAYFAAALTFGAFGLLGPENLNAELLVSFYSFCLAATFVLGYGRRLEDDGESGKRAAREVALQARPLALSAGLVLVLAGLGATLLGSALYRVTPNLVAEIRGPVGSMISSLTLPSYAQVGAASFAVGKGPVSLSDRPVMLIHAPSGHLWRGAVYDEYTGAGWDQSLRRRDPATFDVATGRWETWWRGHPRARTDLLQDVELLNGSGYLLIAAAEPEAVRFPPTVAWALADVRFDAYNCGHFAPFLAAPTHIDRYTVWSRVSDATPEQLANASTDYPQRLRERYVSLPLRTEANVKRISDHIVGANTNPYAKARAIEGFLRANYMYTTEGPYIPASRDAVVEFLTSDRRGACDLFASAFVVLARAQGIPARIATGYATGEYSREYGAFVVRESDAHAWAEVYFPGYGWISFDPTAGASRQPRSLLVLLRIGAYGRFVSAALKRSAPLILGGLLLVWVATSVLGLNLRRAARRLRQRSPTDALADTYLKACALFGRRGCPRPQFLAPGEFLQEASTRMGEDRPLAVSGLRRLTEVFVRARYGPGPPSTDDLREARSALRRIHLGLRRRRPRDAPATPAA